VTGGWTFSSVEDVFREEHGRLLGMLVRQFGDLDLAEEAASEAIESALQHWPVDGVPKVPLAWLLTTARRKAVDRLRRDNAYAARLAIMHAEAEHLVPAVSDPEIDDIPDERLRLFFTCCHPALSIEAQIALTLRCVGGLSTPEVARAFLVAEATMAQRIVRAKRKISQARIPIRVPEADELAERLLGVLHVLYLIFTEGHTASMGEDLMRVDLTDESIRLARILHRLLPAESEVSGLLAMFLLVDARRSARVDAAGDLVSLEFQDRSRWDVVRITEGNALAVAALQGHPPGRYALQAAIAALHDEAAGIATTDWAQIVALYDLLLVVLPSPVVQLNRAMAVAMRDGPDVGLAALDALCVDALRGYHLLPAARADLLRRVGRTAEAAVSYQTALGLVENERERTFLQRKLAEL
jgi:RNA polymerase sigma-70 factor, ECF subfamily